VPETTLPECFVHFLSSFLPLGVRLDETSNQTELLGLLNPRDGMDVSIFFTRLLQSSKEPVQSIQPDDIGEFDKAWHAIQVGELDFEAISTESSLNHEDRRRSSIPMSVSYSGKAMDCPS